MNNFNIFKIKIIKFILYVTYIMNYDFIKLLRSFEFNIFRKFYTAF